MTYRRLPSDLPGILRSHGLRVVETSGWRHRGRPSSTGAFHPGGVLCHHTATPPSASDKNVVDLLIRGRSDLPGPLAQFGLSRNGTVYLIASGRANHAGRAKPSGTMAGGDGNALYMGIEAFNDGVGEAWPSVQYSAYVLLAAVLSNEITKNSYRTVRGHKETSVTGKIDPTFSMDKFRIRVAAKMRDLKGGPKKAKKTKPKKSFTSRGGRVDRALKNLKESKGHGRRGRLLDKAVRAVERIVPFR